MSNVTATAVPLAGSTPQQGRFIVSSSRAREWLDRFTHNRRPLSKANLSDIKGALTRDEFRYNGQPIIISLSSLTILNGRHRLEACAATGRPIDVLIVLDVEDEAFKTMDKGKRRNNADDLAIDGERNAYALAATITWVWRWEQRMLQQSIVPSPSQNLDVLRRHPGIRESVSYERRHLRRMYGGSVASFIHYVTGQRDTSKRNEFFELLSSGVGLGDGSPVLLLRERLFLNAAGKSKLPPVQVLALYLKAWAAFKAGRTLRYLRWRQDGEKPEAFPEIV